MPTLEFKFKVSGALTDATSVLLSDPTGVYGVKRLDTGAVVIADGVAMARASAGVYRYTFTAPAAGLNYSWFAEVVYNGVTYRFEKEHKDGTDAQEMVDLLKAALRDNPIGIVSVTVDGQSVTYSRRDALAELRYWQGQVSTETNTRPRAFSVKLDGF